MEAYKKAREEWTDFPAKFSIHGAQTFTPIRVSKNFWGNILRYLGHQDLPQEVFEAGPPPNKVSKYTRLFDDF